jgi:hypothetical protein
VNKKIFILQSSHGRHSVSLIANDVNTERIKFKAKYIFKKNIYIYIWAGHGGTCL